MKRQLIALAIVLGVAAGLMVGQVLQPPAGATLAMDVTVTREATFIYRLEATPAQLAVYRNGVRLKLGLDYVVLDSQVLLKNMDAADVLTFDVVWP